MLSRFVRPVLTSCGRSSCLGGRSSTVIFQPSKVMLQNQLRGQLARRGQTTVAAAAEGGVSSAAGTTSRVVGWWMAGCAGMCFGAVVLGGVTRLTESGLSMTDWTLLGKPPPRTQESWEEEFEKYKLSPEFKYKNFNITMEEFKFIWYMEYGHRMWGRSIGAFFYLPAGIMWAKGMFSPAVKRRVLVAGALLGFQGLLGWYMVKSGLDHKNFEGPSDVPRVSQYRLAAHLSSAVVLYSFLFWNAKDILKPALQMDPKQILPWMKSFRKLTIVSKVLPFVTLVSGAFVAGLDAGLVYNSFPKFADRWIPEDILAFSPTLRNITENPTTVQFNHRVLGTTTLAVLTVLSIQALRLPLPPRLRTAALALGGMAWMQVGLGVATLLLYVPVPVAAAHQSGAVVTLSLALWLAHEAKVFKVLKHIPK